MLRKFIDAYSLEVSKRVGCGLAARPDLLADVEEWTGRGDDPLLARQSLDDRDSTVIDGTDHHVAPLDLVTVVDDVNVIAARIAEDRALGKKRGSGRAGRDPRLGEAAGPDVASERDCDPHLPLPGLRVDDRGRLARPCPRTAARRRQE
jgi:hypothetical protein